MTVTTGAGFGFGFGLGITQNPQSDLTGQVGQGGQLANYMAQCRWPGGGGEGGRQQLGETLMRDGEQEVGEGEQLIEMGDVQDGMALVNQGTQLIMEGAAQMAGGMMPGGMNPFDPMGGAGMGGQDPCNPMGGYGSPGPTGMGGQDPCNPMGGYGSPGLTGMGGQDPYNPIGMNGGNGFGGNCGCGGMSVDTANNSITIGDTKITASADGNTITATDVCTGKTLFTSSGDPHLTAGDGSKADYQQSSVTINLPGGGVCHIDPGPLSNGVAEAKDCIVTYGNQAAKITFGANGVQTTDLGGQGYALDETTPAGVEINSSQDGSLTLANGGQFTGNLDADATNGPMGFGAPYGTGMAANGGNFAQLDANFGQFMGIGNQAMLDSMMDV
jgi:hypothetical protein